MIWATYRYGEQVWTVDESDRVTIMQDKKLVVVGFSHSRAWTAMMNAVKSSSL